MKQQVIERSKSVIPACDVETLNQLEELVKQTTALDGIGGYKVGFELGLGFGLPVVVDLIRKYSSKPIIYDHQKAGTDIPDTGKKFANVVKKSGVDSVIFFPQAGPETEKAWINYAFDNELKVIIGGIMTHSSYLVSEGGFFSDDGALNIYKIAVKEGVNNFVVPGNKPFIIKQIRDIIETEGISPVFYAPGFIKQGGEIATASKVAGNNFHVIVGRGIYQSKNMLDSAIKYISQL